MFRPFKALFEVWAGFPHARGDVPAAAPPARARRSFSPRTWGCSVRPDGAAGAAGVFPTHVGMFRSSLPRFDFRARFPHARGDVPPTLAEVVKARAFSPRTWGCSVLILPDESGPEVFPTHVGMFRAVTYSPSESLSFPHARGDVPPSGRRLWTATVFPRTWGCSAETACLAGAGDVFPTHVGMFRCFRI